MMHASMNLQGAEEDGAADRPGRGTASREVTPDSGANGSDSESERSQEVSCPAYISCSFLEGVCGKCMSRASLLLAPCCTRVCVHTRACTHLSILRVAACGMPVCDEQSPSAGQEDTEEEETGSEGSDVGTQVSVHAEWGPAACAQGTHS